MFTPESRCGCEALVYYLVSLPSNLMIADLLYVGHLGVAFCTKYIMQAWELTSCFDFVVVVVVLVVVVGQSGTGRQRFQLFC